MLSGLDVTKLSPERLRAEMRFMGPVLVRVAEVLMAGRGAAMTFQQGVVLDPDSLACALEFPLYQVRFAFDTYTAAGLLERRDMTECPRCGVASTIPASGRAKECPACASRLTAEEMRAARDITYWQLKPC